MAFQKPVKIPGLPYQSADSISHRTGRREPGRSGSQLASTPIDVPAMAAQREESVLDPPMMQSLRAKYQPLQDSHYNLPPYFVIRSPSPDANVQATTEADRFLAGFSTYIGADGSNRAIGSSDTRIKQSSTTLSVRGSSDTPHAIKHATGADINMAAGHENMAAAMPMIRSLMKENKRIVQEMGTLRTIVDKLERRAATAENKEVAMSREVASLRTQLFTTMDVLDEHLRGSTHSRIKTKMQVRSINAQLPILWEALERLEVATIPRPAARALPGVQSRLKTSDLSVQYWSSTAYNSVVAGPRPDAVAHLQHAVREIKKYNNSDYKPRRDQHPIVNRGDVAVIKDILSQVTALHTSLRTLNSDRYAHDRQSSSSISDAKPNKDAYSDAVNKHGENIKLYEQLKGAEVLRERGREQLVGDRKRQRSAEDDLDIKSTPSSKTLTRRPMAVAKESNPHSENPRGGHPSAPTGPKESAGILKQDIHPKGQSSVPRPDFYSQEPIGALRSDCYPERGASYSCSAREREREREHNRESKRRDTRPRRDWDRPSTGLY